jgi:hypothetical protein
MARKPRNTVTVNVRGRQYKVAIKKMPDGQYGWCRAPYTASDSQRTIALSKAQANGQRLETIIHELLHACLWDLDEAAVAETAKSIARAIPIIQDAWDRL